MRPFLVCIHDVSPAYAREVERLVRDLAPLVGRRIVFGVVPDWHGAWPLTAHRDFCDMLLESSDERLLHGCFHRRRHGRGPVSWLTGGADEMNGLDAAATVRTLEHGQRVLTDALGQPARGFLAPAWQSGLVRPGDPGIDHVLGFLAIQSAAGRRIPLATWTWDCGRWDWLGHIGHRIGSLLGSVNGRVPVLALHPCDLERGFRPAILRLTRELLQDGREPTTVARLLETGDVEAAR